ncbi:SRPBCC family protein (plasmid) [Embleya sp. NBC_00888]|uniref:SRPBCC family protein n=1 Tax=Embleya sp. NBC_00888 TaxID=2975960 RepID=UPI002F9150E3|nr:SRPBCC family protein [Embleya sp. NBC_00888]
MSDTQFTYVLYIRTTPEVLWHALTDRTEISRYFDGSGPESDWQVGSPVRWSMAPRMAPRDAGQVVLTAEPPVRLAYTWHNYEPEIGEMFGWSPEQLAEYRREPISRVSFDLVPLGEVVALRVLHDGFAAESEMLKSVREGWPMILSNLKTLLETGEPLRFGA